MLISLKVVNTSLLKELLTMHSKQNRTDIGHDYARDIELRMSETARDTINTGAGSN